MKASRDAKINLLNYKLEEQREAKRYLKEYAIAILIIGLLAGTAFGVNLQQQKKIEAITKENQILHEQVEALIPVEAAAVISSDDLRNIESHRALVHKLEKESKLDPLFVEQIYLTSQPDIIINKMNVKDGELKIEAYTNNQAAFINFVDRLKANRQIKEVRTISSTLNEKTGEVKFSLTMKWEVQ